MKTPAIRCASGAIAAWLILAPCCAWGQAGRTPGGTAAPSTYRVVKSRLVVTVPSEGEIKPADAASIYSPVAGSQTIVSLVEEGRLVKQGQEIARLDDSALRESLLQQRIVVERAEADLARAKARLEQARQLQQAELAAAELAVKVARMELERTAGEGGEQELGAARFKRRMEVAEARLKSVNDNLARLESAGAPPQEIEALRTAAREAQAAIDDLRDQQQFYQRRVWPAMVATGEAKVAAALAGRLRVAIQYEATLAQAEADVTAAQAKTAAEMAAAQRIEEQVALCQIRAPRDGLVVYPPAAPERGPPQLEPLAEGSTVRERQRLLLVCNPEKFLLELRVPEARIAEVRPGQAAAVRLEAVRQKTFTGKVARVSPIPLSSSWRGPDEKFYSVTVDLESGSPELKFGMSAAAQILVAEVSDVLTVPIEAIHRPNGTAVCQVKVGNQREVRQLVLGLSDGRQVEVRQGLKEGDEVFLFPRAPAAPSGEGAAPSR